MSHDGEALPTGSTPTLPTSIWVVAWASVAGQIAILIDQGSRNANEVSLVGSVILGALVVDYVSSGVVRARTLRLVVAWVVLIMTAVAQLAGLVSLDDSAFTLPRLLLLASTVVTIAALYAFSRSDWYSWQSTKPPTGQGASIRGLVFIALVVGVLGGLAGSGENGIVNLNIQVSAIGSDAGHP